MLFVIVLYVIAIVCACILKRHKKSFIKYMSTPEKQDIRLHAPATYNLLPECDVSHVRLSIVSMTRQPIAFETWLKYHKYVVGVEHFFIVVEDTPDLIKLLSSNPWNTCVTFQVASAKQGYFSLMDRQHVAVTQGIDDARKKGMTHIAHIDDDELIYCPNGVASFKSHLAHSSHSSLRIHNLEAIYDSSQCIDPFKNTKFFNVRPTQFTAYVNGKSIGNISDANLAPWGPHNFTGSITELPSFVVVILHYESACIQRWRKKFEAYAIDTPSACEEKKIGFRFYCDSIDAFVNNDAHPEKVWYQYKTLSKFRGGIVQITNIV